MREQGCMYHIWAPERQVQLLAAKGAHLHGLGPAVFFGVPGGGIELADAIGRGVACVNDEGDVFVPKRLLDPRCAGDDLARLICERKPLER
jgi:hypothetical protein